MRAGYRGWNHGRITAGTAPCNGDAYMSVYREVCLGYRFFLVRYEFPFFSVPSFPSAARSFAVRGCGRMVHPVGHVVKRHQPPQTRDIYHVSHSTRARALSFLFKISSFQRLKPSLIPRPQKKQLATPHTPTHASPNHISYLWSMPLDKRAVCSVSGCKFIRR